LYGLKCACVELDLWHKDVKQPADSTSQPEAKRLKHSFAASKKRKHTK
jgi:hypothetical protein